LQDASMMSATKSTKKVRALGAMERLFWLMDQNHSAHLTVTAEVKGITEVQNWRDALDAVQRRHPILSTSINRNEDGQPALYQVDAAPIPLRVVDGSVQGCWELEVDREMAVPFTPEQAPLVRSVLIHKPQSAVLIMVAHHAIADGMALVFLIRDLLQVLTGGQLEALSFSSSASGQKGKRLSKQRHREPARLKRNLQCTEKTMVWHRGSLRESWTKILLRSSRSERDAKELQSKGHSAPRYFLQAERLQVHGVNSQSA
jgi:NRPS condensation-like uncharacterized protein